MSEFVSSRQKTMSPANPLEQWRTNNLVSLLKYDGFIQETAVRGLEEKYTSRALEVALEYSEHSANMLPIILACDTACSNMRYYANKFWDENDEILEEFDDFAQWYIENIARLTNEECQRLSSENAKERKERMLVDSFLENYDNLQKRLLRLSLGYEGPQMTVEEIAALPEFDGRLDYIRIVMDEIHGINTCSKGKSKRGRNKEVHDNAKV